jgi:Tfp pilus assembly protein PilW
MKRLLHRRQSERGESLLGMLVALGISMTLFAAATSSFLTVSRRSMDSDVKSTAIDRAKTVLGLISYDLRMAGAGMPLGQVGFTTADAALGDAPLPVLTASTASRLEFRLNERAVNTVLTADYTPGVSSLTFQVAAGGDLEAGDTVYLNNMLVGGTAGLRGVISSVGSGSPATVTLSSGYVATPATTFKAGSTVDRVTRVVYSNAGAGITRTAETSSVVLAPLSSFSATYLDGAGATLAPPLTADTIINRLAAVRLTVTVPGERRLSNSTPYTAEATTTVAIRNLNINR